jgi:RNA polymerase-binding protein DksA
LDKKDLEHFRKLLLEERKRVVEDLSWMETNYMRKSQRDSGSGSYGTHPADMGTDSSEMEKAYLLGSVSGEELEDIDEALERLDGGEFGKCTNCGADIARERLEAVPHAQLCLKCKSESEGPRRSSR